VRNIIILTRERR